MNMNKTLLAATLAAATLGVSSSAMALTFTDGAFTGSTDLTGTITVPVATNYWQWAAGDAISYASIPVTQLTNSYKTLTLPAASNLALLVGQTKQATVGNAATPMNPQIALKDAKGNVLTPVWVGTGNTGKGTITLPVTAADGSTALGSMVINVQAGAIFAQYSKVNNTNYQHPAFSDLSGAVLYGKFALPVSAGAMNNPSSIESWLGSLGVTKTLASLLQDLNQSSGSSLPWGSSLPVAGWSFSSPGDSNGGAYGLGIAQGDNIVVNFTNPVTASTVWKAPLKMTVTYI